MWLRYTPWDEGDYLNYVIGHTIRGKEAEGESDTMMETEFRVLQFEDGGGATSQGIKAATKAQSLEKEVALRTVALALAQ